MQTKKYIKNKYLWVAIKYLVLLVLFFYSIIIYFDRDNVLWNFPYSLYIVKSDSMQPTFRKGDILISKLMNQKSNINSLQAGDIITFDSPIKLGENITHRIVEVNKDDIESKIFRTKGDSNIDLDPWIILESGVKSKTLYVVPYLGNLAFIFSTHVGWFLFVILPVMYIVFRELSIMSDNLHIKIKAGKNFTKSLRRIKLK